MRFHFFRISIVETKQQSLFQGGKNKNEILREILAGKFTQQSFPYRGTELGFVVHRVFDNYLHGSLGKKSTITQTHSPQENFQEENLENWRRCNLILDLSSNKQIIAFEHKASIFENPLHQLRALSDQLNQELKTHSYEISINPITEEKEFWKTIKKHAGKIEELVFTFTAPNVLNLKNNLNDDLNEAKKQFAFTKTKISLKNDLGNLNVPEDNPLVNQGLEYARKGGGEIIVKVKAGKVGRKVYDSNANKNVKSVDQTIDFEIQNADEKTLKTLFKKIFKWLE